jgi:DNA adenine methylase
MSQPMKITAIAPWFGSKRTLATTIVHQLGKHSYYFEACAGSMAVLLAKEPSEHEVVCDLHGALTNLAWVVQDDEKAPELYERLQRMLYDDELYQQSKEWLGEFERGLGTCAGPSVDWAYHYFVASWMGRNGVSGTARVNYQIATRWTKGGGSGPGRFRAAVESIPAWHDRLRNVHILRRSMFDVLPKLQDDADLAIYADPPYLADTVAGNSRYLCDFTEADHRRLAEQLQRFKLARVVVSYYAHPLLKKLYPGWEWLDCSRQKHLHVQNKRGTGRKEAPEVLLVNGEAYPDVTNKTKPAATSELFA